MDEGQTTPAPAADNGLIARTPAGYPGDYQGHLLEQYKLYVESVEKTSDRRQTANNYFFTINTALISLIGVVAAAKESSYKLPVWVLCGVGIVLCIVWWFSIRAYKQLNTGKFAQLHEIEEMLPLRLYKHEWRLLGEGKQPKVYYPFSHIELLVPWLIGGVYTLLALGVQLK